jgi:protein involved in polysaccharide export with SLBB domain
MVAKGEFPKKVRAGPCAAIGLILCAGCLNPAPRIRSALKDPPSAAPAETVAAYTLSCPDVIDISFANWPNLSGRYTIDPDGTITIANVVRIRVDGQTAASAESRLANVLGVPARHIAITMAEYRSRLIFLFGPGSGAERAVAYQGAESVVDLLRRTGGLSSQAKLDEVFVLRPQVAAGRRPELFNVDLEAILIKGDESSNIVVQPYDHVYVGTTRRSVYAHYLLGGDWNFKPAPR